jgi:hypothetical protein
MQAKQLPRCEFQCSEPGYDGNWLIPAFGRLTAKKLLVTLQCFFAAARAAATAWSTEQVVAITWSSAAYAAASGSACSASIARVSIWLIQLRMSNRARGVERHLETSTRKVNTINLLSCQSFRLNT